MRAAAASPRATPRRPRAAAAHVARSPNVSPCRRPTIRRDPVADQPNQQAKGEALRELHAAEPFVIPNPWDAGSAKILAAAGFKALATTSSGFAFTLGRLDGEATLDEVCENVRQIDSATPLPVSTDLENGHGRAPEDAATAIRRVAEAGAVGGSIEDFDRDDGLYEAGFAAERIAAAAEAAC